MRTVVRGLLALALAALASSCVDTGLAGDERPLVSEAPESHELRYQEFDLGVGCYSGNFWNDCGWLLEQAQQQDWWECITPTSYFCQDYRCGGSSINDYTCLYNLHSGGTVVGTPCDDGNACTSGTSWQSNGTCGGGWAMSNCCTKGSQCDDGNPCTSDYCSANQCGHNAINSCCTSSSQCGYGYSCNMASHTCVYAYQPPPSGSGYTVSVTYSSSLFVSNMKLGGVWCEHGVTVSGGNVYCGGSNDGWYNRGAITWPSGNAWWNLTSTYNSTDACFAFTIPMVCSNCGGINDVFSSPGGPSAQFSVKAYRNGARLNLYAYPGKGGGSIGVICGNKYW